MKALLAILAIIPVSASADTPHAPTRLSKVAVFDFCALHIHAAGREKLSAFAKEWKHNRSRVTVEGNALAVDEESSIALGQHRADRVRDYLIHEGVDAAYITAIGNSRGEPGRYVDLVVAP